MPRIKLKNVDTGKWEELPLIQGKKGDTGTSITKVEQTTTSTESSGKNTITVTLSDGTSSTFTVTNGAKGDKGEMGSLEDGSITTEKLADGAITNAKLAQKSVTPLKLADYSVTNVKVADYAIDDRKLARDSVTTEHVVDRAITMRKLAQKSVATPNLVDGAVTSDKIDWTTLDTGWKNLSIDTNNATAISWRRNAARIIGRTLYITMGVKKKTSTGWPAVAYLPDSISKYVSNTERDFVGRADSQTGGVVAGGLTKGKELHIYSEKSFEFMVDTAFPLDY